MAIVRMNKLHIVGLQEEKQEVINSLMKLGAVELSVENSHESDDEQDRFSDPEIDRIRQRISRMKSAIDNSDRYYKEKKPMLSSKRKISGEDYEDTISRIDEIDALADELSDSISKISNLNTQIIRYKIAADQVEPWIDTDIELEGTKTRSTQVLPGMLASSVEAKNLREMIWEQADEADVVELTGDGETLKVCVVYHRDLSDKISSILKSSPFRPLAISVSKGSPREAYLEISEKISDAGKQVQKLKDRCIEISQKISEFEIIYDHSNILLDRALTQASLTNTKYTFTLNGWIPSHLAEEVHKALDLKYTVAFSSERPMDSDEYPILLKNHPLVKPYEVITEMFSPPSNADVDPTPIMAPFFLLIFSMMLSDAGYGLMLAAGCALLLWKFKVTGNMRSMAMFIFQGGLAAVIWGVLFGGFFGDLVSVITSGKINFPTVWFNPIDDPTRLMVWSVIFGILHMFAGMLTKAYILIITGKWKDAVFDVFSWISVLSGIGMLLGGPALGIAILSEIGKYLIAAGLALIILFGGRSAKNPVMRILKGIMGLYDITSYFSDALSYTRILALSLATAVIGMVVNMLGGIMGFSFMGIILFILVGILGHLLNLAISTLGCYVHTSRLQYVEFFSKFYEGGGRTWNPLSIKTKYIDITNNR